jgi:xanthine dehydrogenase accessory factor
VSGSGAMRSIVSEPGNSVNHSGTSLSDFFAHYRARNEPLVLATVVQTIGSTYRKAGAQMLIARDSSAAGLLSGGCLESDLMERARKVLDTGAAMSVEYDTRSSDDILWGIGLGCEGAMTILLTRIDAQNRYEPFAYVERCRQEGVAGRFALVTASGNGGHSLGKAYLADSMRNAPTPLRAALALESAAPGAASQASGLSTIEYDGATFLVVPVELPRRLLVLGAGPDAMPLVEIAALMGWRVTVLDHRPAYAVAQRFPRATRVSVNPAGELAAELRRADYDAAVVMSHHLTSDQMYLDALADSDIPYIGLLGPALRRSRLMSELGDKANKFGARLHGPIGLDIGARTPETIALSIVSEIQARLAGRSGRPFSSLQTEKAN